MDDFLLPLIDFPKNTCARMIESSQPEKRNLDGTFNFRTKGLFVLYICEIVE